MKNQFRQGDVLIEKIDKMPKGLKRKDQIIALGEVTGHKHFFPSEQVLVYKDENNNQFVNVQKTAELVHDEHQAIKLEKGNYKIVMQRQFDLLEGIKQVM